MPKAFISYARDGSYGENLAVEIYQQLKSAGFDVFRDVIGLKPGDVWYHKLEFELESSDVMVLVVSEKVRTSKWVHNEVSMAEEIGIPVIPVLAEKVRYPLWLRHLQSLDFCGVVDWSLLLGAIGHHVSKISADESTKITTEVISGHYIIHSDCTVTDPRTKLMWKRCSEGQSGRNCGGEPASFTWSDAMSKFGKGVDFAGYNDWSMPSLDELHTLVDKSQYPTINHTAFPNTPDTAYWSSRRRDSMSAWTVRFYYGRAGWGIDSALAVVRLVRSVQ